MRNLSIIAILLSTYAMCFGQQDTTQLDTITPNDTSRQLIKELTDQLAQIEQAKAQTTKELMLVITGYLEDPRRLAGFTKDYKILVK